jgi:hypothetical protein
LDEGEELSVLYSFTEEVGLDELKGSPGSAQHVDAVGSRPNAYDVEVQFILQIGAVRDVVDG